MMEEKLKQQAYKIINDMAFSVVNDNNKYQDYLNVQSNLDMDSVGNSLLVASQFPKAKQVKLKEKWEKLGVDVIDNNYILKLIPNEQYDYDAVKMYDISQTNSRYKPRISYDNKIKLSALLNEIPLTLKVVNNIPNTENNALWNSKEKILYIKRDYRPSLIFSAISREYAKALFSENDKFLNFKSDSVSYMLCKKYGIAISDIKAPLVPREFAEMNSWQIRSELSSIREVMLDINNKIEERFIEISEKKKIIDRER